MTTAQWRQGSHNGTAVRSTDDAPCLWFDHPAGTEEVRDSHDGTDHTLEYATWLSSEQASRTPAGELIASWNANTPPGTAVRIEVRVTYSDGNTSPWYTVALWTAGEGGLHRGSVAGQGDGSSSVDTDTVAVCDPNTPLRLASFRCRLTLFRTPGQEEAPTVRRLDVLTSDVPDRSEVPTAPPGPAHGISLSVPAYSQTVHTGRYPEYNGGGQAWCSPASSQMVIEYWGRYPSTDQLAWVDPSYDDPQVCHAARLTYDHTYRGCGNWPFNVAYAATYPRLQAAVTRLDSLTEAEHLVAAGIPLIVSMSFHSAELDGADYDTTGHLLTVVGFTTEGDVISNDPAAADNTTVCRVYDRRQFETIWLRTRRYTADGRAASGTGGVCYLYFPLHPKPEQLRVLQNLGLC